MRGQRLFIRPIEPADAGEIRTFLANHSPASSPPSCGLVGKLVGDVVAVLSMELTPEAVRIVDLVVATELRKKRIGRGMIAEAEAIARKMERPWLVAENDSEFLRRVGFSGGKRRVG